MKIYSMGDGLFESALTDLENKPCLVLVADTREELSKAMQGIGLRDDVTVVAQPSGQDGEKT